MHPDEININMEDYGYFIDIETKFYVPEKVEFHPHSDSDLQIYAKQSERNVFNAFTATCVFITYVSIIYLLSIYRWLRC